LADKIGDPVLRARIRFQTMWARYQQADLTGVDALLAEIGVLAETIGLAYQRWRHSLLVTGRFILAGLVEDAEVVNEEALKLGIAAGAPEALGVYGGVLYNVRWHQGRFAEISDLFIDAARDNPSIAVLRAMVPLMLCELGRTDEAQVR